MRAADCFPAGGDIEIRYAASRGKVKGTLWMAAFPWHLAAIAAQLARFRPHVVHINFATGGSLPRKFLVAALARLARRRVIIHFHGDFPQAAIAAGTVPGRLFVGLGRLAHRVVALGEVSRGRFIEHAGVSAKKVRILPNGIVDFAGGRVGKQTNGPVRILFAGEVGERKGVGVLVAALQRLPTDTNTELDWRCTIAGNGDIARYEAMVRDTAAAVRIHFTGWLSADAVHRLMLDADIVVLPSDAENMPLSLIEGACAGAALVATPVAETRAIVYDEDNGLIVSRDPEVLGAALTRLTSDRTVLARMQMRSRDVFEQNFTIEAFAARLAAIYREAARA